MKSIFILILLVCVSVSVFSQGNYQDVVYLKNGSIIRGIIIEQVPNKSIKIETSDRNIFVYQMDDIEKLTKERIQDRMEPSADHLVSKPTNQDVTKSKDIFCIGITGASLFPIATFGDHYDSGSSFGARVYLHSVKGKKSSAFGLSIGLSKFKSEEYSSFTSNVMPITFFSEDYFGKGKVKGMWGYEIGGYNFKSKGVLYGYDISESKMKFGAGPYLGVLFDLSKQLSINAHAKYNYIIEFKDFSNSPSWLGINLGVDYKF